MSTEPEKPVVPWTVNPRVTASSMHSQRRPKQPLEDITPLGEKQPAGEGPFDPTQHNNYMRDLLERNNGNERGSERS